MERHGKTKLNTVVGKVALRWKCYKQQIIWMVLFYLLQLFLFGMGVLEYFHHLSVSKRPFSALAMVGIGFGMVLQVDCGILLLGPALRYTTGLLRGTWLSRFTPVDSFISFHIILGFTVCIVAACHTGTMVGSFYVSTLRPEVRNRNLTLGMMLTQSGFVGKSFLGYTALSGWVALACLSAMAFFALAPLRKSTFYDAFYWTHKLQLVFWASLIVHTPDFWKYFVGPFSILLVEKAYKYANSIRWYRTSHIMKVHLHPGEVTNLFIKRPPSFNYYPGDYCLLRVPSFGLLSWHPFTISSNPETDDLSFHIKGSGNYTKNLRTRFHLHSIASNLPQTVGADTRDFTVEESKNVVGLREKPSPFTSIHELHIPVFLAGPYRSSSMELFNTEHAVLVAAGIGITPFASVLGSLLVHFQRCCHKCGHHITVADTDTADKLSLNGKRLQLRKVDFIWVVRDPESVEWFADLFDDWERALQSSKVASRFMTIQIYITSNQKIEENKARNPESGLLTKILMGRPNWPAEFKRIQLSNHGKVRTFYCGPHPLQDQIRRLSAQHDFDFSWENF